MAVRSAERIDGRVDWSHPPAAPRWKLQRHRLVVVAPTVVEVVRYVGGWLFDQTMAGWDSTALVSDPADSRPLHILGACAVDLRTAMADSVSQPRPQALAVASSLYTVDPEIRRTVNEILDEGSATVILWGDEFPAEVDGRLTSRQHRLTAAARAFKAQALAAAAISEDTAGPAEMFRTSELRMPQAPKAS